MTATALLGVMRCLADSKGERTSMLFVDAPEAVLWRDREFEPLCGDPANDFLWEPEPEAA